MRKRNERESTDSKKVAEQRDQSTLFEVQAREEWQSCLVTCDGQSGGVVVRKVIEPASYMIRYLIVYRPKENRHFLIPASTVSDSEIGQIHCTLTQSEINRLLPYTFTQITRTLEQAVHATLDETPYWIEEHMPTGGEDE